MRPGRRSCPQGSAASHRRYARAWRRSRERPLRPGGACKPSSSGLGPFVVAALLSPSGRGDRWCPLRYAEALRPPLERTDVDSDHVPIPALAHVGPAGAFAHVADGDTLSPDVIDGASGAGGALDDDVAVGHGLGMDREGSEALSGDVRKLLGSARRADDELPAVVFIPHRGDVRAAVRADSREGGDVWLAEKLLDIRGEDRHPRMSSRPVKRSKASRYFSAVRSTTSGGSSGAGGALFQAISSR